MRRAVQTNCAVHHTNILLKAVRISRCRGRRVYAVADQGDDYKVRAGNAVRRLCRLRFCKLEYGGDEKPRTSTPEVLATRFIPPEHRWRATEIFRDLESHTRIDRRACRPRSQGGDVYERVQDFGENLPDSQT